MATPNKAGKKLIEFNCKNGVYSVNGTEVKPLGYLVSNTLDKSISTKDIYGDGELQLSVLSDRGMTGTLEMTARDDDFETEIKSDELPNSYNIEELRAKALDVRDKLREEKDDDEVRKILKEALGTVRIKTYEDGLKLIDFIKKYE